MPRERGWIFRRNSSIALGTSLSCVHSNKRHGAQSAEGMYRSAKKKFPCSWFCSFIAFSICIKQVIVKIPVEDRELDGVFNFPCEASWNGCAVILTHGAGGDMNYLHLEKLAAHLASTGILCLRFTCRTRNFKYRIQCFTAVVVRVTFLFVVGD